MICRRQECHGESLRSSNRYQQGNNRLFPTLRKCAGMSGKPWLRPGRKRILSTVVKEFLGEQREGRGDLKILLCYSCEVLEEFSSSSKRHLRKQLHIAKNVTGLQ